MKGQSQQVVCLRHLHKCFESSMTNNVDPDQSAPVSILIWGPHCFYTYVNQQAHILVK